MKSKRNAQKYIFMVYASYKARIIWMSATATALIGTYSPTLQSAWVPQSPHVEMDDAKHYKMGQTIKWKATIFMQLLCSASVSLHQ